jgi:Lrp/AsnC family transcriptional regulator for asnA, asnC and gidA
MPALTSSRRRRRDWVETSPVIAGRDADLVRLLHEDGRRPLEQLAAELGMAKKTVRRHMDDLGRRGAARVTAVGRPAVLGYGAVATAGLRLDGSRPLRAIADDVGRRAGVVHCAAVAGRYQILAELWCAGEDDLVAAGDELVGVAGVSGYELHPRLSAAYQAPAFASSRGVTEPVGNPAPVSLDELDRRIVARLREDGRVTYQALAAELHVTDGQARGRVLRLLGSGAIEVTAISAGDPVGLPIGAMLAIRAVAGALIADVVDNLADVAAIGHVAVTAGRFQLLAELACRDLTDLQDLLETRIRRIAGIAAIEPWVYLAVTKDAWRL